MGVAMRRAKWIIPLFLIVLSVSSVMAQQCLGIVTDALELASKSCKLTARNEVCYGNFSVTALPSVNPDDFKFDSQGDIVPIDEIAVMELDPFDEDKGEWGIVVGRMQAQLPDTLPGQNVTVILFGGVSLQNDGVDDKGVQAFRFTTGIGSSRCLGLPPDGMIIDTPEGSSFMTFSINGTEITLGSTAFLDTYSDDDANLNLRIGMLDGLGFISADGETTRIEAGQQTTIPLDDNLEASGTPGTPEDFEIGNLGVMMGFIAGLGFDESGATSPPDQAPPTEETPASSGEPCTVSTTQSFSAGLRVGPGLNRTRRAWLEPNVEVTVTGVSDDGEWWQLDKFEAFPSGANSVVELWVLADEVTASGDCSSISFAAAPPIVAPPPAAQNATPDTSTAGTGDNTNSENVQEPIVEYWTQDVVSRRIAVKCTDIFWHVEYVSAMYLVGDEPQPVPLAGITGSYRVCGITSQTYYLRIVYTDGSQQDFPIFVRRGN